MTLYNGISTLLLVMFCSIPKLMTQKITPEQVVQKQLEAYNQRNIEAFMSVMAPDVTFHDFSDGIQTITGKKECRRFYSALFEASPSLYSTIITHTVFGNKVIDHESITGRNGNKQVLELVLIYEVQNEKIFKVTVLKKEE
mgnify:CR=1 FL=1